MRLLAVVIGFLLTAPAAAEQGISYPVSVPPECVQLARREHVPLSIKNRYQAVQAHYKLASLNGAEPLVAQCWNAVERLRHAAR